MTPTFAAERIALDNIFAYYSDKTFSQRESARIVGGLSRLRHLVTEGKVAVQKDPGAANCKMRYNAAEVLMHIRNMRTKPSQTNKTTNHVNFKENNGECAARSASGTSSSRVQ